MPVSTKKEGRESPRTVSHETVIRRGGAQAPTVKYSLDDAGSVIATSIRIASRDGDFGPTSHATRSVSVPLRPQAPRTVAFASGADHPAPDAGAPNFDVDFAWMRQFSARASRLASPVAAPTAISLDIITAPVVAPHERPVWAHECSVCRDEWSARATLETPVLTGICTGHDASTCPECIEAHAVKVARATEGLSKGEIALSTAKTPKAYGRAEKRVAHWKSELSRLGHTPQGMCPRHDARPTDEARAVLSRGTPREHMRTASPNVSTLYATLYAAPPSWSRDALAEGIAAGITCEPDASKIRRATVIEPAPRETAAHDAYALRGVGVVAVDATYHARRVAEKWRQRARATDKVCAVCRRAECPSVRRTGAPCGASALAPAAPPTGPSKRPHGVYVAPSTVSAHGLRGGTYRAPEETLPKPRAAPARVESPAVTARRIEGERTTPERAHGPYEIAPRGRIVA